MFSTRSAGVAPYLDVDEYSGYRWFASLAQRLKAVEGAPLGKPRSRRLIDARADDIPVFDTGEFTFNFAQLFRTDRFSSAARVRVRTRFVQKCTLSARAEAARADEVIERLPGHPGDLGDRALRDPEPEESADLVLFAVEA